VAGFIVDTAISCQPQNPACLLAMSQMFVVPILLLAWFPIRRTTLRGRRSSGAGSGHRRIKRPLWVPLPTSSQHR